MQKLWSFSLLLLLSVALVGCSGLNQSELPINITEAIERDSLVVQGVQEDVAIDREVLEEVLVELVSDKMAGRWPGTAGSQLAVDFLKSKMILWGLISPDFTANYLHHFEMKSMQKHSKTELIVQDDKGIVIREFNFGSEFKEGAFSSMVKGKGEFLAPLFYANSFDALKTAPDGSVILVKLTSSSGQAQLNAIELILSADVKPAAILFSSEVSPNGQFLISAYSKHLDQVNTTSGPLSYVIDRQVFDYLVELSQKETLYIAGKTDMALKTFTATNVIGFLPGEVDRGYIITAHFDHLGDNFNGSINAGALDNASGTASMMALAHALSTINDRFFSYYFVAFDGEEQGLWGSEALAVSGNFDPQDYRVLNIDMLGSNNPQTITVASTSRKSSDMASSMMNFLVNEGFISMREAIGASDHFSFEQEGFEAICINEFDQRYYHTALDTIENSISISRLNDLTQVLLNWVLIQGNVSGNK